MTFVTIYDEYTLKTHKHLVGELMGDLNKHLVDKGGHRCIPASPHLDGSTGVNGRSGPHEAAPDVCVRCQGGG